MENNEYDNDNDSNVVSNPNYVDIVWLFLFIKI